MSREQLSKSGRKPIPPTPPVKAPPDDAPPTGATPERAREALRLRRYEKRATAADRDLRIALDHIEDLERLVGVYENFSAEPIRPVKPTRLKKGKRPAAAVALLSDLHIEERVDRTPAIQNEYNLAIAEARLGRFFAALVPLIRSARMFDVGTLVLWLGGDIITGSIHDELLERAEVPPGEATMLARDWLVDGIRKLLAKLPETDLVIPCSIGNHGRTTKKMHAATGYGHSWEWVLYQMVAREFYDEPRVQVHSSPDEMQYVEVLDRTLAFHHGHRLRYNGGIGGITIPAVKAVHRWEQWRDCDYYHFGHFHTRIDLGQIAFNGSLIGPSPYGFAIGAAPEPPQQSFYILDDKRGKTMSCPVWVAE